METIGLVEKKRRGLGLPSILYIKSFLSNIISDSKINKSIIEENGTSRGVEIDTSVSVEKETSLCPDNGTVTCATMEVHQRHI